MASIFLSGTRKRNYKFASVYFIEERSCGRIKVSNIQNENIEDVFYNVGERVVVLWQSGRSNIDYCDAKILFLSSKYFRTYFCIDSFENLIKKNFKCHYEKILDVHTA